MSSIFDLKPRFQDTLRPLAARLIRAGFKPNDLAAIALAGSFFTGLILLMASAWHVFLLFLPIWLFLKMAFDRLNEMLARELGLSTPLGAVLVELGDVVSDLLLYLPLLYMSGESSWPIILFLIGGVLTEFSGVLGQALGASRSYAGPMGKSERALVVGVLMIVTVAAPSSIKVWPFVFNVCALLAAVTCWNRLSKALKELGPPVPRH